jgi:hypothetical protein
MNNPNSTPLATIMRGDRCVGFLLRRGPKGIEAYAGDERSLGIFTDEHDAVAAVLDRANGAS